MAQHVVRRGEEYLGGTRERPEVGIFTQTHATRPPVPWNRISVGERVGMKWSGGPIVATAKVQGFRQLPGCTPEQLRGTTTGFRLHDLLGYWSSPPTHVLWHDDLFGQLAGRRYGGPHEGALPVTDHDNSAAVVVGA
jgi:hypothetical protein